MAGLRGGAAVGRKKTGDTERVEFRASPEWVAWATAEANRLGLGGLSAFIRWVVNRYREEVEQPETPKPKKGKKQE